MSTQNSFCVEHIFFFVKSKSLHRDSFFFYRYCMVSFNFPEGLISLFVLICNLNIFSDEEVQFFFGLAKTPAHVEDRLDDAWLQFAKEKPCEESTSTKQQPTDGLLASAAGDGGVQPTLSSEVKERPKKKKNLKVPMEAMIRGFEKFIEEPDEHQSLTSELTHNVAVCLIKGSLSYY